MLHIINALLPVFSLIVIGYFFKKIKFPSLEFWPMADKLTYYVLMPSLLIYKIAGASLEKQNNFNFVLAAILTILTVLFILIIINKFSKFKGDAFTSIVQGAVRFNTYILLALSDSLFGDEGLILAAVILTFAIPLINVISLSVFAIYLTSTKVNFLYLLKSIITNPLIIACIIGSSVNYLHLDVPVVIEKLFAILSQAALPMGLMSVGFGLVLREIKKAKMEIFISNAAKLLLTPFIMYIFIKILNLDYQMASILMVFSVLPTAPSSFVLARQLKGDINLMSSIITVQTLLSILVISIVLNYIL